jgi:hypothetical protein
MGSRIYPTISSPVKSIQRGTAASAGNITVSSVNVSKSFVTSFSTGSAGTVAGSGNTNGTYTPSGGSVGAPGGSFNGSGSFPSYSGTRSLSGGSTSLASARYGAYLVNSTTVTVTGACSWQLVEYS